MTLKAVPVDFGLIWNELGDVCQKVIRCDHVPSRRWHQSFSNVYALCVARPHSHSPRLYEAIAALLRERITEITQNLLGLERGLFLSNYVNHWDTFHKGLVTLDNLFKFLNDEYVLHKRPAEADMFYGEIVPSEELHCMEILQLGLSLWKTLLMDELEPFLSAHLLTEISNDRSGINSQQKYVVPCLQSFLRIDELEGLTKISPNTYCRLFEVPLIEQSRTYYTNWADNVLASVSCTAYISQAVTFLQEETNRAEMYYKKSQSLIISLFNEIFVQQHLEFLNASIANYIQSENMEVLKNLYQLLAPTNRCAELVKQFGLHVKNAVDEIISGISPDPHLAPTYFVENLLETKNRFTKFIADVFDGSTAYRNEMDKAFGQSINAPTPIQKQSSSAVSSWNMLRAAEYLSRFMDGLLRKPNRQTTDAELAQQITASIDLFKYIEEKDVFKQYYQKNLCYRLLFCSSTILELEESTISQIHAVCGYDFTCKFRRMFNDAQLSKEHNVNFQTFLQQKQINFPFTHYCHVLSFGSWPPNVTMDMQFLLPPEIHSFSQQFKEFYTKGFTGRNLHWVLSHCNAEIRVLCTLKPYILVLSAINATVLMLFEALAVDEITKSDLATRLFESVDDKSDASGREDVLRRAILPLVEADVLHLLSSDGISKTSSLTEGVILKINRNYWNRRAKVKLPFSLNTPKVASNEEREQIEKYAEEDRCYFIQAAIVRIMKGQKTCSHAILVKSVIEMAKGRFHPNIPFIKRCIEGLIEKEFIQRSPTDPDQFNYIV